MSLIEELRQAASEAIRNEVAEHFRKEVKIGILIQDVGLDLPFRVEIQSRKYRVMVANGGTPTGYASVVGMGLSEMDMMELKDVPLQVRIEQEFTDENDQNFNPEAHVKRVIDATKVVLKMADDVCDIQGKYGQDQTRKSIFDEKEKKIQKAFNDAVKKQEKEKEKAKARAGMQGGPRQVDV